MAEMSFPDGPSNGQTSLQANGKQYIYNAAKARWDGVFASPGAIAMVPIEDVSVAAVAEVDIPLDIVNYSSFEIRFFNTLPADDDRDFQIQTSSDGGVSFDAGTGYDTGHIRYTGAAGGASNKGVAAHLLMRNQGGLPAEFGAGTIVILNPANAAEQTRIKNDAGYRDQGNLFATLYGYGLRTENAIVDAVRLSYTSASNIATLRYELYGFKAAA